MRAPVTIHTIGHGNRPLEELLDLLARAGIACLMDVRAFPGSRRHPHFGRSELERTLPAAGIEYVWEGATMGGRRRPRADSPHVWLRNASFRAYADHMENAEFSQGVERLIDLAREKPVAIMCAERLPWQCHRYMIADYLVAHGHTVLHIMDAAAPREHSLRPEARVCEGHLIYDGNSQSTLGFG
jgi:uncharacterized protein (DUF488 family)